MVVFWRIPLLFFLAFALLLVFPVSALAQQGDGNADDRIEDALVYLKVTSQRGDWYTPWQRSRTTRLTGSGFIIGPGLVMTNAHVVSDAKQIIVRRNGVSTPFFARVKHVAHDSDLALLEVRDRAFDEGVEPLELGSLPSLRTRVRTYGFPSGGEELSRTEGVVSRVQFITYLHSGADGHLGIQTDAAINPGNSGGPVVQGGKVIGVAFQTSSNLNDVGFFIPAPVIKRFLKDIQDSRYDGYGELGIVASNLTNPAYRRFLNLPDEVSGVVVDRVLPGTSAEGHIFPGDVVTAIDGVPIRFDGTIQYHGHPLNFAQIAEEKQVGETLAISVWRDGRLQEVSFPLLAFPDGPRLRSRFDQLPRYFVFAGLVFMELDQEYLKTFGNYWQNARKQLLYSHFFEPLETSVAQKNPPIVLTRVLPHPINSAYRGRANSLVRVVNGRKIETLADLPAAFRSGKEPFHRIELAESGIVIVLDREEAERAHEDILRTYGIGEDRRL